MDENEYPDFRDMLKSEAFIEGLMKLLTTAMILIFLMIPSYGKDVGSAHFENTHRVFNFPTAPATG